MWKLLREGQEMTMQLEKEKHDDRLKELKDEVDHLLERLTYEATITNWPLKVLPIVMKNQAFGNLLANQEEHVALHVIFTRSNYDKFNKLVYPIIEKELEQYCDKHWSTIFSPSFIYIALVILVGQIIIVTFGREMFGVSPLSLRDWGWLLLITSPVLVIADIKRFITNRIKT